MCLSGFNSRKNGIMANFDLLDDDYSEMFLTQQSHRDICVSLEEDGIVSNSFPTVKDPKYSDISDTDDEPADKLRCVPSLHKLL